MSTAKKAPHPPRARTRATHLLEELQLRGVLQELPHGSRAVVGHEGLLTEGDRLLLANRGRRGWTEGWGERGRLLTVLGGASTSAD